MLDILKAAGRKVVDDRHAFPLIEKTLRQVRSNESGSSGNKIVFQQ
jgi:hypothetical protein